MPTPSIPPVLGSATRAYLTKIGPVLKQAIDGAKPSDIVEAGLMVNGALVMTQIGTAAEIRNALSEMRML
jgi:hypothetical protein